MGGIKRATTYTAHSAEVPAAGGPDLMQLMTLWVTAMATGALTCLFFYTRSHVTPSPLKLTATPIAPFLGFPFPPSSLSGLA
eukprot:scaffold903_cov262-Pinguiococcus_pyrenoidosus.AAC.25